MVYILIRDGISKEKINTLRGLRCRKNNAAHAQHSPARGKKCRANQFTNLKGAFAQLSKLKRQDELFVLECRQGNCMKLTQFGRQLLENVRFCCAQRKRTQNKCHREAERKREAARHQLPAPAALIKRRKYDKESHVARF